MGAILALSQTLPAVPKLVAKDPDFPVRWASLEHLIQWPMGAGCRGSLNGLGRLATNSRWEEQRVNGTIPLMIFAKCLSPEQVTSTPEQNVYLGQVCMRMS